MHKRVGGRAIEEEGEVTVLLKKPRLRGRDGGIKTRVRMSFIQFNSMRCRWTGEGVGSVGLVWVE